MPARASRQRRRRAALTAVLFLTLASCTAQTPSGGGGSGGGTGGDGGVTVTGTTTTGDGGSDGGTARPGSDGAGGTTGGAGTDGSAPATSRYRDGGSVGEMARTYLRSSPARALVVEIDYVAGRRPGDAALRHLRAILERELRKPDGIDIRVDDEVRDGRSRWTTADIARFEDAHRDTSSRGDRASLWVGYLDGEYEQGGALGVAYRASAFAVFADRMRDAATAIVMPSAIERAVLVHEAGHLLALVNIGYQSRYDHEDPDHPHHSRYRSSVMYWAIEDISITQILSGGPPADFDRYDRADLEQLREEG